MKYSYIVILMLISFMFTSCFTKPEVEEIENPIIEEEIVEESTEENEVETSTGETSTGTLENPVEENEVEEEVEENQEDETSTQETPTWTWTSDDQAIIEWYEADLEALFNDILGE